MTPMKTIEPMEWMEVWGGNRSVDSGVIMPGLDAWLFSQPCQNQAAGGDVHYVSASDGGQAVRMVVADIAGHGARVADAGARLRLLMRRHISHENQLKVVRSLNREFTASANGVFATAVVMTFDPSSNRLLVSNAGHPPPLWYQSSRQRWTLLEPKAAADAGGIPWGIEHESAYEEFHAPLEVGDIVLCYTDALTEAKDADGELLGSAGLLRVVEMIGKVKPSQLIPRLLMEISRYDAQYASRDDVTCLTIRANGLVPHVRNTCC